MPFPYHNFLSFFSFFLILSFMVYFLLLSYILYTIGRLYDISSISGRRTSIFLGGGGCNRSVNFLPEYPIVLSENLPE